MSHQRTPNTCMTSIISIPTVHDLSKDVQGFITTGDKHIDDALGGGIFPGTITEFVGGSSTGKTQLALQLSLMVQLPRSKGGLEGSTCYITSTDILPTSRLVEIKANHPHLSALSVDEALGRIETESTRNSVKLRLLLKTAIPRLREKLAKRGFPLRLLVIDSIDFILTNYDTTETTAKTLFERSKDTTDVALLLHRLASEHDLAIVVINSVHSVFNSNRSFVNDQNDTIVYLDQAQWFGRGDGISIDGPGEAALGLVWANQVGTRVMLTRTGRRKHFSKSVESKRRLITSSNGDATASSLIEPGNADLDETVVIRQLSVVFSQFAPPVTLDYIITSSGVVSLNAQEA